MNKLRARLARILALGSTFLTLLTLFIITGALYVVAFFYPPLLEYLESAHLLELLTCGLLLEVMYLMLRSERTVARRGLLVFPTLGDAMAHVFAMNMRTRQLRVFAHSSDGYYNLIRNGLKEAPIEAMTVLLRDPDCVAFLPHVQDEETIRLERQQIRTKLEKWKSEGGTLSQHLRVFEYQFEPSFDLCIFDDSVVVLELFKPYRGSWGFRTDRSYVIVGNELELKDLVQGLLEWYESIISDKCKQVV